MVLSFEETAFSRQMIINKMGKENRGENRQLTQQRAGFCLGFVWFGLFLNKFNMNNLTATVNIDQNNRAGLRDI